MQHLLRHFLTGVLGLFFVVLGIAVPFFLRYSVVDGHFLRMDAAVHAGIPFMVHDVYATQLCVSTESGRLLTPIVVSAANPIGNLSILRGTAETVHANIPFVVRDAYGTQVCISSRDGKALPPLVAP